MKTITIEELTAERDSLKTENDTFTQQLSANAEELKKTKELNYTLARQISREPAIDEDAEITKILKDLRRQHMPLMRLSCLRRFQLMKKTC